MVEKEKRFDVTVIGGGPAGLFAAFCCGMRGLSTKVIEASSNLGGKVARFYPEKYIYDVGGVPGVRGSDLVDDMVSQARRHQPEIIMDRIVEQVEKQEDGSFCLTTNKGDKHYAKTVIATSGMGRYGTVPLQIENANKYEGRFLHYTMNQPEVFQNKAVAVVSDHRVGIEWALALEKRAESVYLINSKQKFAGVREGDMEKLAGSSINVLYDTTVSSLKGDSNELHSVVLSEAHHPKELEVHQLLVYLGVSFAATPFESWQIKSEKNRVVVDYGMESNVEGFFAAGDAAIYPHKSLLIANGYTEAITAVNRAAMHIDKTAPAQVYSTVVYRDL